MGIELLVKMTAATALLAALLSHTEAARHKVRGHQAVEAPEMTQ